MPNAVGDETFKNWFPNLCSTKSAPSETIKPIKSLHFAHKPKPVTVWAQNKTPKITLMLAGESNLG